MEVKEVVQPEPLYGFGAFFLVTVLLETVPVNDKIILSSSDQNGGRCYQSESIFALSSSCCNQYAVMLYCVIAINVFAEI